jgi:hypothetical protein
MALLAVIVLVIKNPEINPIIDIAIAISSRIDPCLPDFE